MKRIIGLICGIIGIFLTLILTASNVEIINLLFLSKSDMTVIGDEDGSYSCISCKKRWNNSLFNYNRSY